MVTTEVTGKDILIRTTGAEESRTIPLTLAPGTLVADALDATGLTGWALSRPDGGRFQPGDNLYNAVATGQKVLAVKVDDLSAG